MLAVLKLRMGSSQHSFEVEEYWHCLLNLSPPCISMVQLSIADKYNWLEDAKQ